MTAAHRLWTKKETAVYLRVTTRTVDNWCAARILPFAKFPCGKRFDPDEIFAFVRSRKFGHSFHPQDQTSPRVS